MISKKTLKRILKGVAKYKIHDHPFIVPLKGPVKFDFIIGSPPCEHHHRPLTINTTRK